MTLSILLRPIRSRALRSYVGCMATLLLSPLLCRAAAPSPPHLMVVIAVDQFSADLYAEYRSLYTAGLRRLSTGVVYPAGYQSHAATETCPGHSTILTGVHPARSGIIANEWFDQSLARSDKQVYCAEDPSVPGSSSTHYTVSAVQLKVPTLGDRLKVSTPSTRVVSVSGKDRAAVMLGGHAADALWYFNGSAYVSPTADPTRAAPQATPSPTSSSERVNAHVSAWLAHPTPTALPATCQSHATPLTVGTQTIGVPAAPGAQSSPAFRTSPAFDDTTTELAIGLLQELHLGSGPATDILAISLSATDYVGHRFGTEGSEMCAQVLNVDRNVGAILDALDATHVSYVVVLTADHGGHDAPERNQQRGFADALRVDPALLPNTLGTTIAGQFGLPGSALVGRSAFGDVYIASTVPATLRPQVLRATLAAYNSHPQIAATFTANTLAGVQRPSHPVDEWSLAERFSASFDPTRSGDVLVALRPHVTPIAGTNGSLATHGSPWNYDRRVPILFYWPGIHGFEQPLPVETVDIVPTLAALIGFPLAAADTDGRCLALQEGTDNACERASQK